MEKQIAGQWSERHAAVCVLGNCHEFVKTIPDESTQLVLTSPPYNIGKKYEGRVRDMSDWCDEQSDIIQEVWRILKPGGSACWQVGNHIKDGEVVPLDWLLWPIFSTTGFVLRNRIIWRFGHGLHCKNRLSGRYEVVLWFTKGDGYHFDLDPIRVAQKYPGKKHHKGPKKGQYSGNPKGKNPSDVWDIPNVKHNHVEKTIHPCQFPVALAERLVRALSRPSDAVFDPFGGVGSTCVAAVRSGRRGVSCEVYKPYHDVAIQRIEAALQGKEVIREDKPVYEPKKSHALTNNPWSDS